MNTATITADIGPGQSVAGLLLENVQGIEFEFDKNMITVRHGLTPVITTNFSYEGVASVSFTIANGNTDVTLSNS